MVVLKTSRELALIREAARVAAEVQERLAREAISAGVSTRDVEQFAIHLIQCRGASSHLAGYRGFPGSVCISLNEEVLHGIPGHRKIQEGDVVKVIIGVVKNGYHAHKTATYAVSPAGDEAQRLVATTRRALAVAADAARAGNRVSHISEAIQATAAQEGFAVIRRFGGHGIGASAHEEPFIPNFVSANGQNDVVLAPGMVFTIEPMLTAGGSDVRIREDGWTVVTADGSLAAHCEHTIAVTDNGAEVLTADLSVDRIPKEG